MAIVNYEHADGVAVISMDDGKANALSFAMFAELGAALDEAAADDAVVLITGRDGRFSGGFDLAVLTALQEESARLLRTGFELAHRLLSFPAPVVIACTGHAYAMGSFLLLSADYRLGASDADHRITANEVAIGMTLPHTAIEICRQRLRKSAFERATALAEVFNPMSALDAGFLDELVPAATLVDAARAKAVAMATLDRRAHVETKLRSREATLARIAELIERDDREFLELIHSMNPSA